MNASKHKNTDFLEKKISIFEFQRRNLVGRFDANNVLEGVVSAILVEWEGSSDSGRFFPSNFE